MRSSILITWEKISLVIIFVDSLFFFICLEIVTNMFIDSSIHNESRTMSDE